MTIAEIAAMAGVSKSAVSRYLNKGYISAEKKEAIRRAIEQTGYVPSQQAQMLRTGKSRMIGVIVPRIHSESISRVVSGISEVLEKNGFRLLLANTENSTDKELEYLEIFRTGHVDGVIFVATMLSQAHKAAILGCEVPVVMIGQQMEGISCFYHDDYGAAKALTELLLTGGRKKIGYIGVSKRDKAAGAERYRGYLDALKKHRIDAEKNRTVQCSFSMEEGKRAAKRLMQHAPDTDAIFCATDSIAIGSMQYLQEAGKTVPHDVMVTGIGHSRLSELIVPRLTTAHYQYQESGALAATELLRIIDEGTARTIEKKLPFRLIAAQSTAKK